MVQNLVYNLCESFTENIGGMIGVGKKPTPITYLTQWKIVGNSEVHTLPYPDGVVLPYGYKRCEYLTFDGNSYINTGIKTANDIGYNLACSYITNVRVLIGARVTQLSDGFGLGFSYVAYGGASVNKDISLYSSSKVNVLLDATQCKIGNENYDISDIVATATTFLDIYVGTWNDGGRPDNRMWRGNIYDTIIYNTQGELWHGIPCLDANDTPCFYDLVSQTAFYNQGSGSFTYKLYPQPAEIWSCGEYNATDGKYHILVQPLGGSIADIALTEPLRKVNDVADTIEFPSETEGKALVTRPLDSIDAGYYKGSMVLLDNKLSYRYVIAIPTRKIGRNILLTPGYTISKNPFSGQDKGIRSSSSSNAVSFYNEDYNQSDSADAFCASLQGNELIYELATPTTELIDAPQIQEADSYSMIISQGGKAVSWSGFETE